MRAAISAGLGSPETGDGVAERHDAPPLGEAIEQRLEERGRHAVGASQPVQHHEQGARRRQSTMQTGGGQRAGDAIDDAHVARSCEPLRQTIERRCDLREGAIEDGLGASPGIRDAEGARREEISEQIDTLREGRRAGSERGGLRGLHHQHEIRLLEVRGTERAAAMLREIVAEARRHAHRGGVRRSGLAGGETARAHLDARAALREVGGCERTAADVPVTHDEHAADRPRRQRRLPGELAPPIVDRARAAHSANAAGARLG